MSKTQKKAKKELKEVRSAQFVDRKLISVNPLNEQFEPTEACAVRQKARMAGQP